MVKIITLNKSNFTNNSATIYGGAILDIDNNCIFKVISSNFINNTAGAVTSGSGSSSFSGYGGVIRNSRNNSNLFVSNSSFDFIKANFDGSLSDNSTNSSFIVNGSIFKNNTAINQGGAIRNSDNYSNLTVVSSSFIGNFVPIGG